MLKIENLFIVSILDCNYRYCDFFELDFLLLMSFYFVHSISNNKQVQTMYTNYLFFSGITLLHLINASLFDFWNRPID